MLRKLQDSLNTVVENQVKIEVLLEENNRLLNGLLDEPDAPSGAAAPGLLLIEAPQAPQRALSAPQTKGVGEATRERWRIVKEAGVDTGGKAPSQAQMEKALRILARRETRASGSHRANGSA